MQSSAKPEESKQPGNGNRLPEKGRRPALFLIPLLVVGVLGGLVYYAHSLKRVVTDDAYVQGTVYSISPRIPGTVIQVLVAANQTVEKDRLLVQLDPEEFSLKVTMAAAGLESAQTQHEEALIGEKAAEAEEKLVAAQLAQTKLDLKRAEALYAKHSVPKEQYDRAVTQHRVLSAQQEVVKAKHVLAKARTASAASMLDNARAQMKNAELLLTYTEVRSPARGWVTNKSVEPGNVVQPGFPLMSIVDLDDVWVEANYKETQLRRLRPGLPVEIEVDTYAGHTLKGHVESIEAGSGAAFSLFPPENATGNWVKVVQRIPVKILLDGYRPEEDGPLLRMGMSAVVSVFPDEVPTLTRLFSFLPGF